MKELSGTAEPSPLALISAGTASAFYVGKFSSPVWLPNHHQSALVSSSHWVGWEEGEKSLGAEVQALQVGCTGLLCCPGCC